MSFRRNHIWKVVGRLLEAFQVYRHVGHTFQLTSKKSSISFGKIYKHFIVLPYTTLRFHSQLFSVPSFHGTSNLLGLEGSWKVFGSFFPQPWKADRGHMEAYLERSWKASCRTSALWGSVILKRKAIAVGLCHFKISGHAFFWRDYCLPTFLENFCLLRRRVNQEFQLDFSSDQTHEC